MRVLSKLFKKMRSKIDFLKREAYLDSVKLNRKLRLELYANRYFMPTVGLSLTMRHTHKI